MQMISVIVAATYISKLFTKHLYVAILSWILVTGLRTSSNYRQMSLISFLKARQPQWERTTSVIFLNHTQTHHTPYGPLDRWSARRKNLHLTTHNTHKGLL